MSSRAWMWIRCGLRITPLVVFLFSGCTCRDTPPPGTSSASRQEAPAPIVPATAPAAAETPTAIVPEEPSPGFTPPTVVPTLDPQAVTAARSACDRKVDVALGKTKDAAVLKSEEVQSMLRSSPGMAICGAVLADSEDLCKALPAENGVNCRYSWSIFHELRANPKGKGYMFTPVEYELCRKQGPPPELCEMLNKAVRAGNPDLCGSGPWLEYCRAIASGDPALCNRIQGAEDLTKDCLRGVAEKAAYGKGLEVIAASGSDLDRELAKAALGRPDACESFAKSARESCAAKSENRPLVPAEATPEKGSSNAPDAGPSGAQKPASPQG